MSNLGIDFYLIDANDEVFVLTPGEHYLFGRSADASFSLSDTLSSREHCEIAWNDQRLPVLRDLNSRNGTYVNHKKISPFVELTDKDQIDIGGTRFIMHMLPSGSDPESILSSQGSAGISRLETFELNDSSNVHNATFNGQFEENSLAGLLRFFAVTDKSGLLVLDKKVEKTIRFVDGTPRYASSEKGLTGLNALKELVENPGTHFSFLDGDERDTNEGDDDYISGSEHEVLAAILPEKELQQLDINAADIAQAENIQQHLLARIPVIQGYNIGLYFQGRSGVSGDCYDIGFCADGRVLIFLADVSGHGVQAAMVVTNIIKTLRFLRAQHHDLLDLMVAFNDEIKEDLVSGQFCTAFASLLDTSSGTLDVLLAGHHAALQFPLAGAEPISEVGRRGLGIGLTKGEAFRNGLHLQHIQLAPGEALLQYTDGLIEATNAQKEDFGNERLNEAIAKLAQGNAQALADDLAKEVQNFATTLDDDLTILVLERCVDLARDYSAEACRTPAEIIMPDDEEICNTGDKPSSKSRRRTAVAKSARLSSATNRGFIEAIPQQINDTKTTSPYYDRNTNKSTETHLPIAQIKEGSPADKLQKEQAQTQAQENKSQTTDANTVANNTGISARQYRLLITIGVFIMLLLTAIVILLAIKLFA